MAYFAIAFIAPNYRDYKNQWLKAYEPGTTTPKAMALDSAAATTVAKLQLNADGFLKSAGDALVIPYIEGAYDLWLFPTSAEADANDTSSAIRVADDINSTNLSLINDLSQAYEFPTVAAYKTFTTAFPVGKIIHTLEFATGSGGGASYTVISGTTPADGVFASSQVSQSIDLASKNLSPNFYPQWGGDQLAFEAAVAANGNCDLLGQEVVLTSSYSMPPFSTIKNGTIKLGVGIDFRGDALCQMIGLTIDANGADYGIQEVITAGTTGMKEGLIDDVFVKNAAVSDVYLAGFHFLLKINRLLAFSSSSSWGVHIFNTGGTLNPDISITNSYIDDAANSKKGYNLQDGSYHLRSCSADTDLLLSSVPEMRIGWLEEVLENRKMESAGN